MLLYDSRPHAVIEAKTSYEPEKIEIEAPITAEEVDLLGLRYGPNRAFRLQVEFLSGAIKRERNEGQVVVDEIMQQCHDFTKSGGAKV